MEVDEVPAGQIAVIATGPLTSPLLSRFIEQLTGEKSLYFYDAISPIVEADSINRDHVFQSSRYGRNANEGDYINCPMTPAEYERFYGELIGAESVPIKDFERALYFESCLPIEELARRGQETLRFGPMKPVGLTNPKTGRQPYAVVQLRQENLIADAYNMVGFQNHLRYGEQERVFRLIPGLERAEFIRLGQIHRNTFVNAPRLLGPTLQLRRRPEIYFAGQICGVEGYVESMAMGLVAGWNALRQVCGRILVEFPRETAIGSLLHYLTEANAERFQPMNINFGLLPALSSGGRKEERRKRQLEMGRKALDAFLEKSQNHKSQIASRR
jgi:methylenetetrahydrofolate--tRNA-(uracil-5-)-methyltransferase